MCLKKYMVPPFLHNFSFTKPVIKMLMDYSAVVAFSMISTSSWRKACLVGLTPPARSAAAMQQPACNPLAGADCLVALQQLAVEEEKRRWRRKRGETAAAEEKRPRNLGGPAQEDPQGMAGVQISEEDWLRKIGVISEEERRGISRRNRSSCELRRRKMARRRSGASREETKDERDEKAPLHQKNARFEHIWHAGSSPIFPAAMQRAGAGQGPCREPNRSVFAARLRAKAHAGDQTRPKRVLCHRPAIHELRATS